VPVAVLESVNLGRPRPNPYKPVKATGIGKEPVTGPVEVRDPGPKHGGLGSGLVGDFIGDREHHGGDEQAVYAFQREDLDRWQERLGRPLPNGFFGENLTTSAIDVAEARVGERWRIGADVEVAVTAPRIPCSTFRGWMGEKGWVKLFTADARPGTYLRVLRPGTIQAGDPITVLHRPGHDVTVSLYFRSQLTERDLLPRLLAAGDDLPAGTRRDVERYLARTGRRE
jgi:MOSC domain-containing protein YiiM